MTYRPLNGRWSKTLVTIGIESDCRDFELMVRVQQFRKEGFSGEISADELVLEGPLVKLPRCRFYFGGDITSRGTMSGSSGVGC